MDDHTKKKAEDEMAEENRTIPRNALPDSILTIDVDTHVESPQEKEDARWHQVLNAHRTRKILTG